MKDKIPLKLALNENSLNQFSKCNQNVNSSCKNDILLIGVILQDFSSHLVCLDLVSFLYLTAISHLSQPPFISTTYWLNKVPVPHFLFFFNNPFHSDVYHNMKKKICCYLSYMTEINGNILNIWFCYIVFGCYL